MTKIAIIRLRSAIKASGDVVSTLEMLRLYRKNYCVVIEDTPSNKGMIHKVKDYVTWGIISEEMLNLLKQKYKEKKFFNLNPPIGGYRGGIKRAFPKGALGNRREKIDLLLKRMIR
ncbi:MAG: uL30 family ribosomal protein [Candidatus Woesearchaeota archaeon]